MNDDLVCRNKQSIQSQRKRRWPWILLVILAVLIYFLLAAPYQLQIDGLTAANQRLTDQNTELYGQVISQAEPENSLRKRAIRLANTIDALQQQRQAVHPPYPDANDPSPQQKRIAEISFAYDLATERMCLQMYGDEIIGIPREMRSKGLDVQWLDKMEPSRCFTEEDRKMLINLAFRLNGQGNRVRF